MLIIEIHATGRDGLSLRRDVRLPDTFAPLTGLEVRMRTTYRPQRCHRTRATRQGHLPFLHPVRSPLDFYIDPDKDSP